MTSASFLSPLEAAQRLGVTVKALRLYEERGFVVPVRTAAGWRAYGPAEMARAAQVVALRGLGFSLAQIARVLKGDPEGLEAALSAHEQVLGSRKSELETLIGKVRDVRTKLAETGSLRVDDVVRISSAAAPLVSFELPWPWGGERFELRTLRPLNFITGPLGSGKTRLALRLAEELPDAKFLGLERLSSREATRGQAAINASLGARIGWALRWLIDEGATESDALVTLLESLESERPSILVVDMIEDGLDEPTQQALVTYLRNRGPGAKPLYLLTRSSAILDLDLVGRDESIIYCPANHSPPVHVAAVRGAPGYECVVACLAPPDVRARTRGMSVRMAEVA